MSGTRHSGGASMVRKGLGSHELPTRKGRLSPEETQMLGDHILPRGQDCFPVCPLTDLEGEDRAEEVEERRVCMAGHTPATALGGRWLGDAPQIFSS